MFSRILNVIAMVFVGLFAGLWLFVAWRTFRYVPTPETPRLILSEELVMTAGLLATTVGAGTAAVLGITISSKLTATQGQAIAQSLNAAVADSPLLTLGILIYFFTGLITLLVWLSNPNEAPELMKAFALGVLGWGAGAFSSVFKAKAA